MRRMILLLLMTMFAPLVMAQIPPVGGSGQVNVNVTITPAPTWSSGIYDVWEVANGTPISYFGFQADVTSSTGSNAMLIASILPALPPTAIQSEWDSGGQYLQTPYSVAPTTGVFESDTFYVISFGAKPPGGVSMQTWNSAYIIVGKPKDAGFSLDMQFYGATLADNDTVTVPLNASVGSCYPAFTASYTGDRVMIRTTIDPLGTTGILESEFSGGPAWVLTVPNVWPISGDFNAPGQYDFRVLVIAEDFSGAYVSEFTVDVPPPALTITTTSPLPDGSAGLPYNFAFAASGGIAPYSWSATGLPSGWQMSTGGQLSTAAAQLGTYNFDVTVTDSAGSPASDTQPFAVTINPLPPLVIQTTSLPDGTQGQAYSATITASGGSASGYDWMLVSGTLPLGITGIPGTGTPAASLGGQPTATGLYAFEVQVTDDAGNMATMPLTIQVDVPGTSSGGGGGGAGGCTASSSSAAAWWWLAWFIPAAGLYARRIRTRA